MGKLGRNMKAVKVVMMMALLFCLFLCPHGASAESEVCSVCGPEMVCHDLCGCQSQGPQHECAFDSAHSHEFRDDTSQIACLDLSNVLWVCVVAAVDAPQEVALFSDLVAASCSHTFAVRHLDTIILRV